MGHPHAAVAFDLETYLDWEERQPEKHEYRRGEVFLMTGARKSHVTVALNLAAAFKSHLRGSPCHAYISDMKLRVAAADATFYPDVMVTCDPRDHAAERYLEHPNLIVEVLSKSTEAFDRGEKFVIYRGIESLAEYVIVDVRARRVEVYRRGTDGRWILEDFTGDASCMLASIDLALPLAAVFEDVTETDRESDDPAENG